MFFTEGKEKMGMESPKMLLVSAQVLPSVFAKVVEAKRLLAVGKVRNLSEAAKASGISRSALYKYKDHVFIYNEDIDQGVVTINVYLEDRPGVLSSLINRFSQEGANILTVNQNIPADGVAPVSVSARLENGCAAEGIINQIKELDGVVEVKLVNSR